MDVWYRRRTCIILHTRANIRRDVLPYVSFGARVVWASNITIVPFNQLVIWYLIKLQIFRIKEKKFLSMWFPFAKIPSFSNVHALYFHREFKDFSFNHLVLLNKSLYICLLGRDDVLTRDDNLLTLEF